MCLFLFVGCVFSFSVKETGLSYSQMFEEIPTVIKNSHLINACLCEVETMQPSTNQFNYMSLSTGCVLITVYGLQIVKLKLYIYIYILLVYSPFSDRV